MSGRADADARAVGRRERLLDRGFAAGWAVVPRLPRPVAAGAFDLAAAAVVRKPGGFAQLRANLRQVIGPHPTEAELDALLRRAVASYTRYWREAFQLPTMDPAEVDRRTETTGWENVEAPLAQGRGVVIALTHSGNWDAAAVVYCKARGLPMTTVAERLRPESLFERFKAYRESLGMDVVPLTGGAEPSVAVLKRVLNAGESITLLGDRDLQGNGVSAELCGRRTTMPSGPALLALQTGAALIPLELGFTAEGWRTVYYPEIVMPSEGRLRERVMSGIGQLAEIYTDLIRRNPQDWHMLQKIWPDV
ncbi:phosphatidylinositol mannoside acyltransferase [Blastococcus sp. Marseille-P5729]|uniref:phosphatidylinositol mannoside acyltransferase n=1 Tax=Blastococcus sp. Marseille-P5729 TaxID=2086582 RepID=UPI000D10F1D0|nr:phosphatidylinositol mannoside acyltransferase [Blastococcus sp. Marseille-P5729]